MFTRSCLLWYVVVEGFRDIPVSTEDVGSTGRKTGNCVCKSPVYSREE